MLYSAVLDCVALYIALLKYFDAELHVGIGYTTVVYCLK